MATQNPYSNSLLMDAFRGSLSNAESLGRGFAVAPVGLLGDINALARQYVTPRLPQGVQSLLQSAPAAPTTEQILSNIPRVSNPRMETAGMEQLGAAMNFKGPVDVAKGAGRLAGNAVNEAMVYGRGPLAGITPQPMRMVDDITGLPLNADGTVTLFHHTNKSAAEQIAKTGRLKSAGEPSVYLTTQKATDTGYGDVAVPVRVKPSLLNLDDEFPSGRMDFSIDTGKPKGSIPVTVEKPSFTYPQEEALRLAQQRAALPVEQGGLGLASNNTAMDRAKAMGFNVDAYHGSKKPNINALDTSKAGENTNKSFDDYLFASTSGENASGYVHDMDFWRGVVKKSPEFKSIEKRESDLIDKRAAFREKGDVKGIQGINKQLESVVAERENIYNDFLNGKYGSGEGNAQTVYPLMAKSSEFLPSDAAGAGWIRANRPAIDAAEEQGYSGALIKNVRDNAGAWSNVTADTYASKDPDLFRSRFAAFDPFRKTAATAAAMGVAAPDLLAQEQPVITQQQIDDELAKYGLLGR